MELSSFVKWAGSKKQLLPALREKMPQNYDKYYEPFIGGGSLFFSIQPKNAVINDVNPQLLNVYIQLKNNYVALIERIQQMDAIESTQEHYLKMREKYNLKIQSNELDIESAALLIWINKHCFNGLYRVNSKGVFNVAFNNRTKGVSISEENMIGIGKYLNKNHIEIRNKDFEEACDDATAGDFIYFDPPYVPKSKTASFTKYTKSGFSFDDQLRLVELMKKLSEKGVLIMTSNNDTELTRELYKDFHIEAIDVRRIINCDTTNRKSKEVIITNYD